MEIVRMFMASAVSWCMPKWRHLRKKLSIKVTIKNVFLKGLDLSRHSLAVWEYSILSCWFSSLARHPQIFQKWFLQEYRVSAVRPNCRSVHFERRTKALVPYGTIVLYSRKRRIKWRQECKAFARHLKCCSPWSWFDNFSKFQAQFSRWN